MEHWGTLLSKLEGFEKMCLAEEHDGVQKLYSPWASGREICMIGGDKCIDKEVCSLIKGVEGSFCQV